MLPSPRIFRSRWAALIWAGGIVWAAVDIAGSAPRHHGTRTAPVVLTDATGDAANAEDLRMIANLLDP